MKKAILWILIMSTLLVFVSCVPKTIEEAYEKAKNKVETFNEVHWRIESGDFQRKGSASKGWEYVYEVNFYAKIDFPSKYEKPQAQSMASTVYRIILKEFGNFDVDLNLVFYSKSGFYICTCRVIDGEIKYN